MLCYVHRLREKGIRLPQPRPGVAGQLLLFRWHGDGGRSSQLRAELHLDSGESAVPVLVQACVTRVTAGGIVIHGTEVVPLGRSNKARVQYWAQTWWCELAPQPQALHGQPSQAPGSAPGWPGGWGRSDN